MALIIVESPNKIPKIRKAVGPGYVVMASVGHIMDLEKKNMGIELDKFKPIYKVNSDKKDVVKSLKEEAKKHDKIYIATDDDREGECIAYNLKEVLPTKGKVVERVIFKTMTKVDIMHGLNNPIGFRENLYDSQQARRITDRVVGFKVSPLMWTKGLRGTSAGRVQSAALKFVVDREKEIRGFKEEEYWNILAKTKLNFDAEFWGYNNKKYVPKNKKQADAVVNGVGKELVVSDYEKKPRSRNPQAPFITSTLQKDAGTKFGWTSKKVMDVAQSIFSKGLITYHRCFPAGTRISTEHGMLRIEDIRVGDYVDTINGPRVVTDVVKNTNRQIFGLGTKHGFSLRGSCNEPILTLNHDYSTSWKRMDQIEPGDFVALSKSQNFSWPKQKQLSHGTYKVPTELCPRLAMLFGFLSAVGSVSDSGEISVEISDGFLNLQNFYIKSFSTVFGVELKNNPSGKNKVTFVSKDIADFLNFYGASDDGMPWIVNLSSKEFVYNYLLAYWIGTGFNHSIFAKTDSMRKDIQIQMLRMGVLTDFYKVRGGYVVQVTGSGTKAFFAKYGETINSFKRISERISDIIRVNNLQGAFWDSHLPYTDKDYSDDISLSKDKLLNLSKLNVIWEEVSHISMDNVEDTWDLTVDEEHHYIAEGFVAHNTDSTRTEKSKILDIRDRIEKQHGKAYLSKAINHYGPKSSSQDAHEAIRPTYEATPMNLTPDERKLLELISDRFMASQMAPAVFDQAKIKLKTSCSKEYEFRVSGSVMQFDGFLKVYGTSSKDKTLPTLKKGQKVPLDDVVASQHFTKPPSRYTEPSFTDKMEKEGIGRPATYAATIETLLKRKYVKRNNKALHATEIGIMVCEYIEKYFDSLASPQFTATMESQLDDISAGKLSYQELLSKFYTDIINTVDKASKDKDAVLFETDDICPDCKGDTKLVKKISKFGVFKGCSNYPKCGYTISVSEDGSENEERVETSTPCPDCGNKIVERSGKWGKWLSCSSYPVCKWKGKLSKDGAVSTIEKPKETNHSCPNCKDGKLVERSGKLGKFYGCNRYPKCKTIANIDDNGNVTSKKTKVAAQKTTGEKCPKCKSGEVVIRNGKFGKFKGCTRFKEGCKFIEKVT